MVRPWEEMGHSGFPGAEVPTTIGRGMPALCQAVLRARGHVQAWAGARSPGKGGQQEPQCPHETSPAVGLTEGWKCGQENMGSTVHSVLGNTRQVVGWKRDPRSKSEDSRLRAAPWAQAHWVGGKVSAHASGTDPQLLLSEAPVTGC